MPRLQQPDIDSNVNRDRRFDPADPVGGLATPSFELNRILRRTIQRRCRGDPPARQATWRKTAACGPH